MDALRKLFQTGPTPQARLHALYALDGLRAFAPDLWNVVTRDLS